MSIRFVYFDLGNVLLDFSHELGFSLIADATSLSKGQVRSALMDTGLNERYERGEVTTEGFCQNFCAITGASISAEVLAAAWSQIFLCRPQSMAIAARLRAAGYRVGILSNTSEAHWDYARGTFRTLGSCFEPIVTSYRAGVMKPAAEIYEIARAAAGVAPSEIFFTDDRHDNVEAARRCGWHAECFEGPLQLANALEAHGLRFNR